MLVVLYLKKYYETCIKVIFYIKDCYIKALQQMPIKTTVYMPSYRVWVVRMASVRHPSGPGL